MSTFRALIEACDELDRLIKESKSGIKVDMPKICVVGA